MRVAVCGYLPLALQIQRLSKSNNITLKFFISDLSSVSGGEVPSNLPTISFFECRRLVNAGELDGIIIAQDSKTNFTKAVVKMCKLYDIPQVGVIDLEFLNPLAPIYWLDPYKIFLPYVESDITDRCNLKCQGCCHFANFSVGYDIYPLENFRRDVGRLSKVCDVLTFRLLGGEPLLLNNVAEYVKIVRSHFPKSSLGIVTNGMLLPSLPQETLDVLRVSKSFVNISLYPPTLKILDDVKSVLETNQIPYSFGRIVDCFYVQMTLNGKNDAMKSIEACKCHNSRLLLNGRLYKCPIDAFSFKLARKFDLKRFSSPTGVPICTPNFSSMIDCLDRDVELCHWCGENRLKVPWQPTNNPKLEDWLSDPSEIQRNV